MAAVTQNTRSILCEMETFLVETLKSVKLSKTIQDQKDRLVEKIKRLLEEIPGSGASSQVDVSNGSLKISGGGDGSSSSSANITHDDEEPGYSDDVPRVAVSSLKNKLQSGILEKKTKKGLRSWESRFCVVNSNIFYIYKKQTDSKQKEAFYLTGYEFREAAYLEKDNAKKEMCFELVKPGCPTYQFRAGSKDGVREWQDSITKGMQITTKGAGEEEEEFYEDVGQEEQESGTGSFPPPPDDLISVPEDIYEETADLGEMTEPGLPPLARPPPPLPSPKVKVEPEEPEQEYDDCSSAAVHVGRAREKEILQPSPSPATRSKDLPPPPVPLSDVPPIPARVVPKAELPALPTIPPPPLPDRRPPLAEHAPPLPVRNVSASAPRVPGLRKPFVSREEDFEHIYFSKWDCSAETSTELSFKRGDLIHVLSQDFDAENWWVGEVEGKIGLVPKEYLCLAYELVC